MEISKNNALLRANHIKSKFDQKIKINNKDTKDYNKKLKDASDSFEELFVHKMIQVMRNSSFKTNLMSGGRGEEVFQDMLDEQYSRIISKNDALGLGKMIYEAAKRK